MEETTLYDQHPAMFRNHPFGFSLAVVLSFVGVGLIVLLIWWAKSRGTRLTVTNHRTILRRGILSKHINEVYHGDIRNVQIFQSFLHRIAGVGTISIASAGSGEAEITVAGMRDPGKVKGILDQGRREKKSSE